MCFPVCVLFCLIKPILGNRYGPRISSRASPSPVPCAPPLALYTRSSLSVPTWHDSLFTHSCVIHCHVLYIVMCDCHGTTWRGCCLTHSCKIHCHVDSFMCFTMLWHTWMSHGPYIAAMSRLLVDVRTRMSCVILTDSCVLQSCVLCKRVIYMYIHIYMYIYLYVSHIYMCVSHIYMHMYIEYAHSSYI